MTDVSHALDVLRIILRHDRENPILARTIQEVTGVDTRNVSELVAEYTRRGFPVCSCARGFFRASTEAEFREHLDKERRRAVDVLHKVHHGRRNYVSEFTLFEQGDAT